MRFKFLRALRAPEGSSQSLHVHTGIRAGNATVTLGAGGGDPPAVPPVAPAPVVAPPAAPAPVAPAPVVPAPVAPAAPAAPAAPVAPDAVSLTPQAFNDRIAQAKRTAAAEERAAILKELGVTDPAAAKTAIAAAAAAAEAGKTQAQKDADAIARLTPLAARAEADRAVFTSIAVDQMAALTEGQQAAVKALAGDDPALQINTIRALRPTWAATSAPAAPAVVPGAPAAPAILAPAAPAAPLAAPAQSAPGAPGPVPTNTAPPFDQKAEVDRLSALPDQRSQLQARIAILNDPQKYLGNATR